MIDPALQFPCGCAPGDHQDIHNLCDQDDVDYTHTQPVKPTPPVTVCLTYPNSFRNHSKAAR